MFSGLSEYLFGTHGSTDDPAMAGKKEDAPMEEVEMDDDWVLVDVTNECETPSPRRSPRRAADREGFQSKPKSVPDKPHRMEESWLVTPPPCFTAGGHSPQQLATSPMEDLLIEHPSMSVYHHPSSHRGGGPSPLHHRRQHPNPHSRPKNSRTVARRSHNLRVRNAKPPRRAAAIAARVGMEQSASETAMCEQREVRKHQQRHQTRGKIDRHNKAYHQQSASSRRHYRQNSTVSGRHSSSIYKQPR